MQAAGDVDREVLAVGGGRYQLQPGLFRVDLDAFDAQLARTQMLHGHEALVEYERALALCKGELLRDEAYEWAEGYRSNYRKRFITAAHRAAKLALECRDPEMAIRFYEGILERDPTDQEAARGVMHGSAALGDTNGRDEPRDW
jgi:two-component SAPR family response regulator